MRNFLPVAVGAIAILFSCSSYAELGGVVSKNTAQIQEQKQGKAQGQEQGQEQRRTMSNVQGLTVYQSNSTTGVQIREFVNAQGVVVAVTWHGPTMPNLKQLLGVHFDEFTQRPRTQFRNHRNAELKSDELVVESHGQMNAFSGRAYLPKLLPAEFNLNQLN